MSVVVVTASPLPEHRAEVIAAFETAITPVHGEPGVELYALHEGPGRLVMIEKYEPAIEPLPPIPAGHQPANWRKEIMP